MESPCEEASSRRWDFRRLPRKVNLRTLGKRALSCAVAIALGATCATSHADGTAPACDRGWRIVGTFEHDPAAFTQGLAIRDGVLFESTGQYGESAVMRKELRTGKVLARHGLPESVFGEGLTRVGDRLFQLTWREETGYVYDLDLKPLATFHYGGEGWGIATMPTLAGERLVVSSGTPRLHVVDPDRFGEDSAIDVSDAGQPVALLNELEFVHGEILANVWKSDRVAAIDPYTGIVKGWYDLGPLKTKFTPPAHWNPRDNVLNGLALDDATGHVFATGKRWPALFELQLSASCGPLVTVSPPPKKER